MLQMLLPNYLMLILQMFKLLVILAISDPASVGHILQDATAASAGVARADGFAVYAGDVCDGGNASSAGDLRGGADIISSGICNPSNGDENDTAISSANAPLCSTDKSPPFIAPLDSSNPKYDRAGC
jgi:hypothetical protein